MCCSSQFADRAGKCKPKSSSIFYSLTHRSIYSKPVLFIHSTFPSHYSEHQRYSFKEERQNFGFQRNHIFMQRHVMKCIATNKYSGRLWQVVKWLRRKSWNGVGSGQGVGVWLAMARVNVNLENRSWLGNAAQAGGEDE